MKTEHRAAETRYGKARWLTRSLPASSCICIMYIDPPHVERGANRIEEEHFGVAQARAKLISHRKMKNTKKMETCHTSGDSLKHISALLKHAP
jgi:hypothetical protein